MVVLDVVVDVRVELEDGGMELELEDVGVELVLEDDGGMELLELLGATLEEDY